MTTRIQSGHNHDCYLELVLRFPLRPIRSDAELDAAIGVIDELTDREKLAPGEQDYLDVLGDLVARYEEDHHPIGRVSDAALLRHLIEAKGASQADVARETGIAGSTISEVLSGGRSLTRKQIGKLASYFHIDPGSFSFDAE